MADNTKIEWTDATWNPITGCSVVSAGCRHCYAMKLAGTRLQHHPSRDGLTIATKEGPVWTGETRYNTEWLDQPIRWRRPRKVFVCAHGDLFHESVPDEWIDRVFAVMTLAPQHTFQVLTKRAKRMRDYMTAGGRFSDVLEIVRNSELGYWAGADKLPPQSWPLPNVWMGVSVEDQTFADVRIPMLLETPAAVRWISAEPLLGPVELDTWMAIHKHWLASDSLSAPPWHPPYPKHWYKPQALVGAGWKNPIDWVVVGGESGANARPMHPDWARSLRDQCAAAGVPLLFKQHGEWISDEDIDNCNLRSPEIADADQYFSTHDWPDKRQSFRVGKKAAGRLLDGVEHNGYPMAP